MESTELLISAALLVRLLAPLLMFRYAALGLIAALGADIVDGLLLEVVPGFDTEHKHPYDKPLDTYYLAIAYLVVLRSWTNLRAIRIARLLWCWRLVGVAAYLITDDRTVFFLCPAAFEFFFLGCSVLRGRTATNRDSGSVSVDVLAGAAVALKLPQEYWLHVKEGSSTGFVMQHLLGAEPDTTRLQLAADHAPWVVTVLTLIGVTTWQMLRPAWPTENHRRAIIDATCRPPPATGVRAPEQVATAAIACSCIAVAVAALPRSDGQTHLLAVAFALVIAAALVAAMRDRLGRSA